MYIDIIYVYNIHILYYMYIIYICIYYIILYYIILCILKYVEVLFFKSRRFRKDPKAGEGNRCQVA